MNYGLLLAAGEGDRFGGSVPKQFQEINGWPVLNYSVDVFEELGDLEGYGILVPDGRQEETWRLLPEGIKKCSFIIAGGQRRRQSVLRGLERLEDNDPDNVLIHDAARPMINVELLEELFDTLRQDEEAAGTIPVRRLRDTVKRVEDDNPNQVRETLPREVLRKVQTPQVFEFKKLMVAHQDWPVDRKVTDDSMMLEQQGEKILTVEGPQENIKLTYPWDKIILSGYMGDTDGE